MRYTVLTYVIGEYELIRPIKEKSPNARYILVTDAPISGDTKGWEVIVDNTLKGSNFDKIYQIRYNPFKYTRDEIVLRIDGSISVEKNLDKIISDFATSGADTCLMVHPYRTTIKDEYIAWVHQRGYELLKALRMQEQIADKLGYNVIDYRGLVQAGFQILRNTPINNNINLMSYAFTKYFGVDGDVERVDQCVLSVVLQKFFPEVKIMWVTQEIIQSDYLVVHKHGSEKPLRKTSREEMIVPYFNNEPITKIYRP